MMNPLVLFDYVYYSIASFYSSVFGVEYRKHFAGLGFLSLFQLFNCMPLFKYLEYETYVEFNSFSFLVFAMILSFNIIRYYKFIRFENLERKWGNDKKYIWMMKKVLGVVYIILSIAFLGKLG